MWGRRRSWRVGTAIAAVAVGVAVPLGAAEAGGQRRQLTAQVQQVADGVHSWFAGQWFTPGMAIGVVLPGTTPSAKPQRWIFTYGVADLATSEPVSPTTQFEIGSQTKVFTGAVLAATLSRPAPGIALSDLLQEHVPAGVTVPSLDGEAITVADVATHRSGLQDDPSNFQDKATYTQAQLFSALQTDPLLFAPSTCWAYSNFGFGTLGTVLSNLRGVPYGDLVHDTVTGPLHMDRTALEDDDSVVTDLAQGYLDGSTFQQPLPAPRWDNVGAMAGGGGLVSTPDDMMTFLLAQLGYRGKAVTVATLATTQLPIAKGNQDQGTGCPADGDVRSMGMGWQIQTTGWYPRPFLFKDGGTAGMHSATAMDRELGIGVTVLSNSPQSVDEVANRVLEGVAKLVP